MADPRVTHATAADPTFSAKGAEEWGKDHTITGLNSTDSPTFTGLTLSGLTSGRVAMVGTGGQIFDDANVTWVSGSKYLQVGTGSGASSGARIAAGVASGYSVICNTNITPSLSNAGIYLGATGDFYLAAASGQPVAIQVAGNNAAVFRGTTATYLGGDQGAAATEALVRKPVSGFSNGVAKAALTFTIPAGAQSGDFKIRVVGTLGASETNGATQSAEYNVNISRLAGAVAAREIGAVIGQPAAAISGGGSGITTTAAPSAVSGAAGATNTFTIDVTLTRTSGSSDNHTAMIYVSLLNANSGGITVS